ncbi:SCO2525 family SAM-dependent methyltransferase [Streptomyces sp. SP17BM10]|uniref:SCO2525 family SAM-dependent methyltransferase n=1 Tax=Streptomyces sp. SP17BM10 TaxID=3002530 RepID=UPI002E7982BA|nr:SCO2525 family SAM-dependent methyltransferase [Streptomyces sp. SP17BM10]MEE1782372.1 SCO2525 family SAM-dependent methyltransferase [Streptomyces sp. SP17BM10]
MPPANGDLPWNDFDPESYAAYNYRSLRADDGQILAAVRDHFGALARDLPSGALRGVDVGSGSNLYPALAMLPWCSRISLLERGKRNVDWLRRELGRYSENWDEFWRVLGEDPAYRAVADPRRRLAQIARVVDGNLFSDLPEHSADIGTMFFVAESVSAHHEEFAAAVDRFAAALRPGAPFAVAFMENSLGYEVGDLRFPACRITAEDALAALAGHAASDLGVIRIETPETGPLRDGYTGILLALGRKGAEGQNIDMQSVRGDPPDAPPPRTPGPRPAP